MNLQEFVSETLKQIIEAVVSVQAIFEAKGGKISPVVERGPKNAVKLGIGHSYNDELFR